MNTPNVSSTNELQSFKAYIEEQQEQMQRIVGDIQNDHKRLVRVLDKSTIANLPSHEVELREYTRSSATGCHDQSQSLYGMPIDIYLGQQQPPTHIGDKFADLRKSGLFAHERGPSGPAAADPIFRSELPRSAPKLPHIVCRRFETGGSLSRRVSVPRAPAQMGRARGRARREERRGGRRRA
jgi:hypothetical protein